MNGPSQFSFDTNTFKGIGLIGKAVWDLSENRMQDAITDFFAGLGMFGAGNAIKSALQAKGISPESLKNDVNPAS